MMHTWRWRLSTSAWPSWTMILEHTELWATSQIKLSALFYEVPHWTNAWDIERDQSWIKQPLFCPIFRSNLRGTWPSGGVSTLFTLISQWNHDIFLCSHQKLQHYSTGTDIYACCFSFQARTVWPERLRLWNLQKRVDRWDWPLNLVLDMFQI